MMMRRRLTPSLPPPPTVAGPRLTMNSTTMLSITLLPPSIPLPMLKERRSSLTIILEFTKPRYCESRTSRKSGDSMFIILVGRNRKHLILLRSSNKKRWDEWVGVDRLMKYTEENLQKKRDLNEKHGNDKNPKAARASQIKSKSSNVARGRKRKSEPIIKETATIHSDKLVNIQIPPTLRKQLVDDCVFVTHLGKLVKLPRSPNVNDVFNEYLDYILKKDGSIADSVDEILKGLRSYFDKALPVILLYKNERHQYQEACLDDVSPSTVYGAEHLLRLFVKLPELLLHADIEEGTLIELQTKLTDFLKFLQKNQSSFFLSTYHVPEDIENSTNKQDD